jgi:putative phage-type endonuclease
LATAYRILDSGKDRVSWLAARQDTLGASEAAAVCGFSRFASPFSVYTDKVVGSEDFDNPVMRFGRIYEKQALQDFGRKTGRHVKQDGRLLASRKRPWQSCTLDAIQRSVEIIGRGLIEAKTSLYGWEAIDGKDSDGIPEEYWCQMQHQFAVTGFKWGSAVMFNRTSCEMVYEDVEPDPAYISALIDIEERFWHDNVLAGVPPATDAHEATKDALRRLYPCHTDGKVIAFEIEMFEKRDRRAWINEELAKLIDEKTGIESEIKAAIGDAEGASFPDGSGFTWKADKRGRKSLRAKERFG